MTLKFFNTLTRKKDDFKPIGKVVKIYSCGPTVYSTQHIGNLRAYVFTDVLKKTIEFAGYKIHDVMNLTDVGHLVSDADDGEDKIEKAARAQKITPQEIAKKYTEQYFADCAKLNIRRPKIVAPATDYIDEMIKFISGLEKKGYTYVTDDGVYFDASKLSDYNKLSRQPIEQNIAGARVDVGGKRSPHDFALWKFISENSLQQWKSPWAKVGAPGWHIECSVIAKTELGDTFDIHTGGVDHITIHHTNEIAQSETLTGKPMCNFWLHNEHIKIDGQKMSKSLGNIYSIADIENRKISPLAFRYLCLLSHYRSQFNFTWDALAGAQKAYENMINLLSKHRISPPEKCVLTPEKHTFEGLKSTICDAFCDDLNTPRALGLIWEMLKMTPSRAVYDAVIAFDKIMSLDLQNAVETNLTPKKDDIPPEITELGNARLTAKAKKDFKTADTIRAEILSKGYEILDTKDGFEIRKK